MGAGMKAAVGVCSKHVIGQFLSCFFLCGDT